MKKNRKLFENEEIFWEETHRKKSLRMTPTCYVLLSDKCCTPVYVLSVPPILSNVGGNVVAAIHSKWNTIAALQ